jgi:hypothetical protein
MATRGGAALTMPDKALLDDLQLVRIAPVQAPHVLGRGKNCDLGSERKVGQTPDPSSPPANRQPTPAGGIQMMNKRFMLTLALAPILFAPVHATMGAAILSHRPDSTRHDISLYKYRAYGTGVHGQGTEIIAHFNRSHGT